MSSTSPADAAATQRLELRHGTRAAAACWRSCCPAAVAVVDAQETGVAPLLRRQRVRTTWKLLSFRQPATAWITSPWSSGCAQNAIGGAFRPADKRMREQARPAARSGSECAPASARRQSHGLHRLRQGTRQIHRKGSAFGACRASPSASTARKHWTASRSATRSRQSTSPAREQRRRHEALVGSADDP